MGKYPYLPLLVLPQIFPSSYYSLSTSLCFMSHMSRISHLKVKRGLATGLEHCGDAMTHKILDHDTQKIIYRSAVRPKKSSTPNHRLAPHGREVSASSDPSEDKISSGSPLGYPEGSHRNRRPLQSSSGSEMKRIHLDPSLCLVEFWGLPPLILFFNASIGWFGRFVLSTECYRTRKLGYNDLNWPRCSAQVTESLALTDGGFC